MVSVSTRARCFPCTDSSLSFLHTYSYNSQLFQGIKHCHREFLVVERCSNLDDINAASDRSFGLQFGGTIAFYALTSQLARAQYIRMLHVVNRRRSRKLHHGMKQKRNFHNSAEQFLDVPSRHCSSTVLPKVHVVHTRRKEEDIGKLQYGMTRKTNLTIRRIKFFLCPHITVRQGRSSSESACRPNAARTNEAKRNEAKRNGARCHKTTTILSKVCFALSLVTTRRFCVYIHAKYRRHSQCALLRHLDMFRGQFTVTS
jgi:hypothetical protein